ncbi:unnamed protein product [Rhizophagus irregularis]|uniref:Uncharacterized protein n=1 Tax=Rhizophagus irregularis TaxID=588596 RepID=A0A915ZIB4_9GLOM|nr:unnamed protein product [Rhizophagus irregularis]
MTPDNRNRKSGLQPGSLLYPRQGKQPRNTSRNNNKTHNWADLHITPQDNQQSNASNNHLNKRIDDLERQVQSLLTNIQLLQQNNTKTDQSIADLHHSHQTIDTSLIEIKERLEKYDTIIQHLTTNINLLSKKKIAATQERPRKISKKVTPYEQTSYRATKSKYNLRNNKDTNTYEDESEFNPTTGDDTDALDENAMSDGASFEGIIDNTIQDSIKDDGFTVKSYNPLNLFPSFNATR